MEGNNEKNRVLGLKVGQGQVGEIFAIGKWVWQAATGKGGR